jgi:hypothetical protein
VVKHAASAPGRLVGAGRTASIAYIDRLDRGVTRLVSLERTAADKSPIAPAGRILITHANVTEKLAQANLGVLRDLVAP